MSFFNYLNILNTIYLKYYIIRNKYGNNIKNYIQNVKIIFIDPTIARSFDSMHDS